jgi:PAS domain S-box-containing protein
MQAQIISMLSPESIVDFSPPTVAKTTSIKDVISLLVEFGYVLVTENGQLLGWVKEKNILQLMAKDIDFSSKSIEEVMNLNFITWQLSDIPKLTSILQTLQQYPQYLLTVIDGNKIGTIIINNVLNHTLNSISQNISNQTSKNTSKQLIDNSLNIPYDEEIRLKNIESVLVSIQKELEKAEDSLLRLNKIVECCNDGVIINDNEGNITYHNTRFIEIFGYTIDELKSAKGGMQILLWNPQKIRKTSNFVWETNNCSQEIKMKSKAGDLVYIELKTDTILDKNGNMIALVTIFTDITSLKKIEENLLLKERAIAASLNGVIILEGRLASNPIIYVNPAFEKLTGYSSNELLGKHINSLCAFDTKQPELQKINEALENSEYCSVIIRNYRKDNSLFWNELTLSPVFTRDSKGKTSQRNNASHFIVIQNDISERKEIETARLIMQGRLKYLLTSSPGIIYCAKASGNFPATFMSDNVVMMLGYEAEKFVQEPEFWIQQIHPEDLNLVYEAFGKIFEDDSFSTEYRFLHQDGDYRWMYDQAKLIRDDVGNPLEVVGYWIDISTRKQLEIELQEALQREKENTELRNRFISMTSHEFRTPLSTILSSAELLQHYRHKWTEEKQLTHLYRIQNSVQHMTNMLDDVLFMGKTEAGKLYFQPNWIDVVEYCRHILEEVQLNIKTKHTINFHSQVEFMRGYLDEKLVLHIVTNLLSNATKYSSEANAIDFNLTSSPGYVEFSIQDQGIGIPEADIPRLFESFHRAINVENISGTGLGLAIVKKCVDIHGGEIYVKSQLDVGTTFTIKLPFSQPL